MISFGRGYFNETDLHFSSALSHPLLVPNGIHFTHDRQCRYGAESICPNSL